MAEAEFSRYRKDVLEKMERALEALKQLSRERKIRSGILARFREIYEEVKSGRLVPRVFEVEPNTVIYWYGSVRGPKTYVSEDKVSHVLSENVTWVSPSVHSGYKFHVLGRFDGYRPSYVAVPLDEEGRPKWRRDPTARTDLSVSRVHGLLLPHPESKGKFLYVHFGKNPPKIEKIKK